MEKGNRLNYRVQALSSVSSGIAGDLEIYPVSIRRDY